MPRIPISQRQVREQGFTNLRGASISRLPEAGNGLQEFARGIEQRGNQLARAVQQQEDRALQAEIRDAKYELIKKQDDLQHGDAGFKNLQGRQPLDRIDDYRTQFNDFAEELSNRSDNPRYKEAFKGIKQQQELSYDHSLKVHANSQMDRYEVQQFQSVLKGLEDHAVLNFNEMGRETGKVQEAILEQRKEIENFGQNRGFSPDAIKQMKVEASSGIHKGVLNQMMMQGDDFGARTYFENVKKRGELDAPTTVQLEKSLESATRNGRARRVVDYIMDNEMTQEKAYSEMRRLAGDDTSLYDTMRQRYKVRDNEKKVVTQEKSETNFRTVRDELLKLGSYDMSKLPPALVQELTSKQSVALKKFAEAKSKGLEVETDQVRYYGLKDLAATQPRDFARKDLTLSVAYLGDTEYKEMVTLQTKYRKALKDGNLKDIHGKESRGFLTQAQTIRRLTNSLGVDTSTIEGKKITAEFQGDLEAQIDQWETATGRQADNDKIGELADLMLARKTVEKNWASDPEVYEFQVQEDQNISSTKSLPPKFGAKLRRVYQELNGGEIDEDVANEIYLQAAEAIPRGEEFNFEYSVIPKQLRKSLEQGYMNRTGRRPSPSQVVAAFKNRKKIMEQ